MKAKFTPTGMDFQWELEEWLFAHFTCKRATLKQDAYYGTDIFVVGIPVDVTLRPSKSRTRWIGQITRLTYTMWVGIRYGNSHTDFDQPVLVLSFDTVDWHSIKDDVDPELINTAMDLYWDNIPE